MNIILYGKLKVKGGEGLICWIPFHLKCIHVLLILIYWMKFQCKQSSKKGWKGEVTFKVKKVSAIKEQSLWFMLIHALSWTKWRSRDKRRKSLL